MTTTTIEALPRFKRVNPEVFQAFHFTGTQENVLAFVLWYAKHCGSARFYMLGDLLLRDRDGIFTAQIYNYMLPPSNVRSGDVVLFSEETLVFDTVSENAFAKLYEDAA